MILRFYVPAVFFILNLAFQSQALYSQCSPDTQAPTAICIAYTTIILGPSGETTILAEHINSASYDNCTSEENLSFSFFPAVVYCSDVGTSIDVLMTVADESGNSNSCFSTVTVVDNQSFALACFADITVALPPSGVYTLDPSDVETYNTDNCGLSYTITPTFVTCDDIGIPVEYLLSATDPGGNTNSCFGNITVLDNQDFAIACFADITVSLPPSGVYILNPLDVEAYNSDNCGLSYTITPTFVTCNDIGIPVEYLLSATDPGGNTNSCFGNITVLDNQAPVLSCASLVDVFLGAGGFLNLTPALLLNGYTDNCDLEFNISPSFVECNDAGKTITVSVAGTDPAGNTTTCYTDIQILDPGPLSCEIISPVHIACGETGLNFVVEIIGGYGPFSIEWAIKGKTNGWLITSGQGTDQITMDAGTKKSNLEVTITDVCGKTSKCKLKIDCDNSPSRDYSTKDLLDNNSFEEYMGDLIIYPNPANDMINLQTPQFADQGLQGLIIINSSGKSLFKHLALSKKDNTYEVGISTLSPGLYFLNLIYNDGTSSTTRFIKM